MKEIKQKLRSVKILVTGGAGFIGSNICERLLQLEAKVTCLDNFSTGNKKNIEHLLNNKNFSLIEGDIRDYKTCLKATKNQKFVLHHAALGSVPRSIDQPLITHEVNITGFINMLQSSKENLVKRFIFAASSSTYGDSQLIPKKEDLIGVPLSPYAVTKYTNELYADVFFKIYGLNYIGLRYFNVFGKNQDPTGAYAAVIPSFTSKIFNLESPTINGDGKITRDFTYIDNVIQINKLALFTKNREALNQVYNVAFGESSTLNELFDEIKVNLSRYDDKINSIKSIHGPKRKGDIPHSLASIEKAKRLLNYAPEYSLKDGLKKAMQWYWEHKSTLEV